MLILCEKPSVAKDFAAALGASKKIGYYRTDDTIITYCVGHLFELCPPETYNNVYKQWVLADLPICVPAFKYHMNDSTAEQAIIVLKLLKEQCHDEVLIATDAGREGELIARIALKEAGIADIRRFKRFWVSEALTPDVILQGIAAAKPLSDYNALSEQGFARQHADWLVGINMTRYMSIGNPPPPFSVGRVQTAVLAAIRFRNEAIKNFIPVPYKELSASVTSDTGTTIQALLENPKTGKTSFFSGDDEYLHTAVTACNDKPVNVVDVEVKEKCSKPEKLLNITGLQKAAFKRFGYKPEETLNLAQSLYETHKCLSYPRTPSRVMGDNNVELFRKMFNLLYNEYALSSYCDVSLITADNKHIFNSSKLEDHHALIPLDKLPSGAKEKERNVYTIVLESFFIVCMPDYIYTEKSFRFHCSTYVFISTVREVLHYGWRNAVEYQNEGEDPEIPCSDDFNENSCSITGLTILEKHTEPKKHFALDSLLAFMEHPHGDTGQKLAGLGTPATRADIIKILFSRNYLVETKKKLFVTDRGRYLVEQLLQHDLLKKLCDVSHTTEWEQHLTEDPQAFFNYICSYVTECVTSSASRPAFQNAPLGICPLCGKGVFETKTGYGCEGYKDTPKCQLYIGKTIAGAAVSAAEATLLLIGQKTSVKHCKNKEGKAFDTFFVLEGGKVLFTYL